MVKIRDGDRKEPSSWRHYLIWEYPTTRICSLVQKEMKKINELFFLAFKSHWKIQVYDMIVAN